MLSQSVVETWIKKIIPIRVFYFHNYCRLNRTHDNFHPDSGWKYVADHFYLSQQSAKAITTYYLIHLIQILDGGDIHRKLFILMSHRCTTYSKCILMSQRLRIYTYIRVIFFPAFGTRDYNMRISKCVDLITRFTSNEL